MPTLRDLIDENDINLREYKRYSVNALVREELGTYSFVGIKEVIDTIKRMIDEMLSIIDTHDDIQEPLKKIVLKQVGEFNLRARDLVGYNPKDDDGKNKHNHSVFLNSFYDWYNSIFNGYDKNEKPVNFLAIYSNLKNYNLLQLEKEKNEIDKLRNALDDLLRQSKTLNEELQKKGTEEIVTNYSHIFRAQALRHSNFNLQFSRPFVIFGNAQGWMIMCVLLVASFFIFIVKLNTWIPINITGNGTDTTLQFITRILIVSFSFYITTFCFKQYNIHKHLYTVNKHRENTLNSYRLFIESLDKSDVTTRNALMMEVAKAIYEAGNSGYISLRDTDNNSSVVEWTRYINPQK